MDRLFSRQDVPKPLVLGYLAFLIVGYVAIVTHTPLALNPIYPHDDGLF